jgi:hypothetical protein
MYEIKQIKIKNTTVFDVNRVHTGKRVARFTDDIMANNFMNYLIRNLITTNDQWSKQPARVKNSFTVATGQQSPSL